MLTALELGSFIVFRYFLYEVDRAAFYEVPQVDRGEYEQYLRDRDPILGWPYPSDVGNERADSSGSRPIPAFPNPGAECVIAFGDSFTYGDEVGHSEAWSNVLAEKLDCRVGNYGVSGYGTDQALIRFQERPPDPSQLAILGIFPHNVMRNVNQYRYFLTGTNEFGFKPRFVSTGNELTRIPIPSLDYDDLQQSFDDPGAYYDFEEFIPGSRLGPIRPGFPYTRVVLDYMFSERVRYYLAGWPSWRGFVSRGHESGAMELTVRIVAGFANTAADRAKSSLVLIFPTAKSYEIYVGRGEIAFQPLLDALWAAEIDALDLHEAFRVFLRDRPLCEVLTNPDQCIGHFNSQGNEIIAEAVYRRVVEARLVRPDR